MNLNTSGPSDNKFPEARTEGGSGSVELLSMPDIYQTAGILNPRKGYGILKVAEMLSSDHLRGNWLTTKQQEAQNITEALDLCPKREASEPASSPLDTSLVSASAKPV